MLLKTHGVAGINYRTSNTQICVVNEVKLLPWAMYSKHSQNWYPWHWPWTHFYHPQQTETQSTEEIEGYCYNIIETSEQENSPLVYVLIALQCFNPTKPLKMSPTWRSSGMHGWSLMHNWAGKCHWRHRNFLDLESGGTSATKRIVFSRWDIFQINQEELNRLIPASRPTSLNARRYVWGIGQCNILLLHIAFTFWPCESVRKTRCKISLKSGERLPNTGDYMRWGLSNRKCSNEEPDMASSDKLYRTAAFYFSVFPDQWFTAVTRLICTYTPTD